MSTVIFIGSDNEKQLLGSNTVRKFIPGMDKITFVEYSLSNIKSIVHPIDEIISNVFKKTEAFSKSTEESISSY